MGERRNGHRDLVGMPEGRRPLETPRRRLQDNIKMDTEDVGWEVLDWVYVVQDGNMWRALVNAIMKFLVFNYLRT